MGALGLKAKPSCKLGFGGLGLGSLGAGHRQGPARLWHRTPCYVFCVAQDISSRRCAVATRSRAPNGAHKKPHRAGCRSPGFQKFVRLSWSVRQSGGLEHVAAESA